MEFVLMINTWSWGFSFNLRSDVSTSCMLLRTFTNSTIRSSILNHKPTNLYCSFFFSFQLFQTWLINLLHSCLKSNNFSTSLISCELARPFMDRSKSPNFKEWSTFNGRTLGWRDIPKLDGSFDPSLRFDFSLRALGKESELTCWAFSQAVVTAPFA